MSQKIGYYDSAHYHGKPLLLDFLDAADAEHYVIRGVAHAIRNKSGRIIKLFRRPKERQFQNAAHAIAIMHNNASNCTVHTRVKGIPTFAIDTFGFKKLPSEEIWQEEKARKTY